MDAGRLLSQRVFILDGDKGLFKNMDLPPYSKLPDSVSLEPIALNELEPVPYRDDNNAEVPNITLDPLDVLRVLHSSFAFREWQIFRSAMIEDSAVIVGSSSMAALGLIDVSMPKCLDVLVGRSTGKAVHTALRNFG